ncbi:MAG: YidC/Oxa1 family membrane protein insertase [Candidatus Pacebacteria bacterium]|nr:YidC/Oxa1 family membrane protein insertase [Candidatus Paceibacterota bacterium]MCF7862404.1 YidC/Oxa1 family membrane protein insertase [Candidatus Paceibacterota bacterium]
MLHNIWDVALYKPLINSLAFLVSVIPGADIGIAIIILTILVKLVLSPLSHKSIVSQAEMKKLEPQLAEIKNSGKSKEEQAKMTMQLYKDNKVNPFSGCLLVLVQIPIIFALYYVFFKGLSFDSSLLYSFIKQPENINMQFLGLIDIGGKSIVLALLAGASQYFQAHFMPKATIKSPAFSEKMSFQESLAKSMQLQMKYVFPVVITFIAYSISGAVALYWITSNIFSIGQQLYAEKQSKTKDLQKAV